MVKIKFGLRSLELPIEGKNLAQLLNEAKPSLGFGTNVRFQLGGTFVDPQAVSPENGAEVTVLTDANQKA